MHGAPGTRAGAAGGRGVCLHMPDPHTHPHRCAAASPSSGLVAAQRSSPQALPPSFYEQKNGDTRLMPGGEHQHRLGRVISPLSRMNERVSLVG